MAGCAYPNQDWKDYLKDATKTTSEAYDSAVQQYCEWCFANNALDPLEASSVKEYLQYKHDTPKICQWNNKRFGQIKGQEIPQLTGELYSILSAIKKYFQCFNKPNPCETNPLINSRLAMWSKDDRPTIKSPVFNDEEPEEFIAYADNSPVAMVYKASMLLYLACAGRKGELHEVQWESLSQITYEDRLCWKVKYTQEKQTGRPEESEAILGDPISNLAFQLYVDCFPKDARKGHFFRRLVFDRSTNKLRATKQNIGQHTLDECARFVAFWNEREDYEQFTSHSFRRTTATRMALNGASVLMIQLAGGWKSEKIARSYVEKSLRTKDNISEKIGMYATTDAAASVVALPPPPKRARTAEDNSSSTAALFRYESAEASQICNYKAPDNNMSTVNNNLVLNQQYKQYNQQMQRQQQQQPQQSFSNVTIGAGCIVNFSSGHISCEKALHPPVSGGIAGGIVTKPPVESPPRLMSKPVNISEEWEAEEVQENEYEEED